MIDRRRPWLTLLLTACLLAASAIPGAAGLLEYRRDGVAAGELWRVLSGQAVHWSWRMTLADLGTLVVLGAWLEIRSRRLAGAALAASALAVGVGVHLLAAGTSVYRGSSGLACGLFTALALDLALLAPTPRHRALLVAVLALFVAKVAWEAATGQALFAGSLGPGVEVLPVAHLLGAAGGAAAWWGVARGSRRGARS